jgi:hypothetical protein
VPAVKRQMGRAQAFVLLVVAVFFGVMGGIVWLEAAR